MEAVGRVSHSRSPQRKRLAVSRRAFSVERLRPRLQRMAGLPSTWLPSATLRASRPGTPRPFPIGKPAFDSAQARKGSPYMPASALGALTTVLVRFSENGGSSTTWSEPDRQTP